MLQYISLGQAARYCYQEATMNFPMWRKALQIIPNVSKDEWLQLDVISAGCISTRAGSADHDFHLRSIAGILAFQNGRFSFVPWLLLEIGLIMAHAPTPAQRLHRLHRGVDQDKYYQRPIRPQRWVHGLMNKKQLAHLCRRHRSDRFDSGGWSDLAARGLTMLFLDWACSSSCSTPGRSSISPG